jgi:undecaprenyl phosphate-alpha-L-ara4N flippase subunit ArnE
MWINKEGFKKYSLIFLFSLIITTNIIGFVNLKIMSQINVSRNLYLFIALAMFHIVIVSSRLITWFKILKRVRLSFAYPAVSITFPVMLFVSHKFFGETITLSKVMGTLLILSGIIINKYNDG